MSTPELPRPYSTVPQAVRIPTVSIHPGIPADFMFPSPSAANLYDSTQASVVMTLSGAMEHVESGRGDGHSWSFSWDDLTRAQLDALEKVIGRKLENRAEIEAQQHQAARWTFVGSGMVHERFKATLLNISANAAARIAEAAPVFA